MKRTMCYEQMLQMVPMPIKRKSSDIEQFQNSLNDTIPTDSI